MKNAILSLVLGLVLVLGVGVNGTLAYEKYEYLNLVGREITLTSGCSYYDSVVAKQIMPSTLEAMTKDVYYTEGEQYVNTDGWEYQREYIVDVPTYELVKLCEDVDFYSNLTKKIETISVCSDVPEYSGTIPETRYEWLPYDWSVNAEKLRYCATLQPIVGFRSVEHVPILGGFEFKEYDYWNSTCNYSQRFTVVNANSTDFLREWNPVVMTFDHADNITAGNCNYVNGSDYSIVYDNGTHNITVDRINISAWNEAETNVTFRVQTQIAAGANDSGYYWYCGCDITSPAEDMGKISNAWSNISSAYSMDNLIDTKEGYNLQITGSVTPDSVTAKFGRSYDFAAGTSYMSNQTKWDIVDSSAVSVEAWIRPANDSALQRSIVSKKQTSAPFNMYQLEQLTLNNCTNLYMDGGTDLARACNTIHYDQWAHVVTVQNQSGGMTLYFNGELANTTMDDWFQNGTVSDFLIGGYGQTPTNNNWIGHIDNVIIYDTQLDASQIDALYRSDIPVRSFEYLEPIPTIIFGEPVAPSPPTPTPNVTVVTETLKQCFDSDTLYEVVAVYNQSGNVVYNEVYQRCAYGCANVTIMGAGGAGCVETPLLQMGIFVIITVALIVSLNWLGGKK